MIAWGPSAQTEILAVVRELFNVPCVPVDAELGLFAL